MSIEARGSSQSDATSGEMPGARMDSTSPEEMMPSGSMEGRQASTHDDMPGSQMDAGDAGSPRFGPENLPPGARPAAAWEPGVVEVQFRDDVAAEVTRATNAATPEIRSFTTRDLSAVNQILRRNGLQSAEPTFLRSSGASSCTSLFAGRRLVVQMWTIKRCRRRMSFQHCITCCRVCLGEPRIRPLHEEG